MLCLQKNLSGQVILDSTLDQFQSTARDNGYAGANKYSVRSAVWSEKQRRSGADGRQHLWIDRLTESATVPWQTVPVKVNWKTFLTVASLKDCFRPTAK
jgi:hypothetical protein